MATKAIPGGTVHTLPSDVRSALVSHTAALAAWRGLTELARNEWICWIVSVTRDETRKDHLMRTIKELKEGKRRPCCWIGCIHRTDKKISPSVRALLNKRSTYGKK